jgi:DNA repair protein RadC
MAQIVAIMEDLDAARAMFMSMADAPLEMAAFAYLDRRHRVLALRQTPAGAVDHVALPIRDVAREALALEAAGLVMAHNHPSDDPTPSGADIAVTRRFDQALRALDLRLVDHLIVTRRGIASFRAMGLL